MVFCAAYGCSNRFANQDCINRKVSFHHFPHKNPSLLKEWVSQIRRRDFKPSHCSRICSDHFEEDCFTYQAFTNIRFLKKDAVPTKFVFNKKLSIPSKRPHLPVTEETVMVKKEKPNKKLFHSVARKKIRKVQVENALVSSTNSACDEKGKQQETPETLHKLGNNKGRYLFDKGQTSDEAEDDARNASCHRPYDSDDIFGLYVASEMRTLKDNPLLYLQTKQSILEILTNANFELMNSQ